MPRGPAKLTTSRHGLNLQEARLSDAYRKRLVHSGKVLSAWASEQGLSLEDAALSGQTMSELLIRFLQDLFELGSASWIGIHAVLAAQTRWRHLKGQLRGAWDSVSSWSMLRPVCSRVPMPMVVVLALQRFAAFAATAFQPWKAHIWWPFAVAVLCAFHGLLRPGELWRLRAEDVRTPGLRSLLTAPVAVFTIREPKNLRFGGRLQVRAVRAPLPVAWISWLVRDLPRGSPIWPFGPRVFAICLREALSFLGLGQLSLTPSSFRAGGATWLFEEGVSISNIRFAGSWSSERVLSHYLQEAEAAASLLDVSEASARSLERFMDALSFAAEPPRLPYQQLAARWMPVAPTTFARR